MSDPTLFLSQTGFRKVTATTNADLNGPITSIGNTTAVASQTGTGSTFVMEASPTLTTPTIDGGMDVSLLGDNNIFVDGETNLRVITVGAYRQQHKAGIAGTRAIHLALDSNGFDDTNGIVIRHDLLNSSAIIRPKCMNLTADVTGATNAHLNFLEFALTGELDPSMRADAIDVRRGIAPIHHHSGETISANTVLKFDDSTSTFTDITTEAGSAGSDVTVFDGVDDYLYFSNPDKFSSIEVILVTGAGNPGIKPTFEYSKGSSVWGTLAVSDDSNGWRENGNVFYAEPADWAVDTVDIVTNEYLVRIKRTANTISPVPTEATMKITTDVEYEWDKDGNISGNSFTGSRQVTTVSVNSNGASIIAVTNTAAPRTITISTAHTVNGRGMIVKDESGAAGTNNITVDTEGGELIDGLASIKITANYGVLKIYSDGTNWFTL